MVWRDACPCGRVGIHYPAPTVGRIEDVFLGVMRALTGDMRDASRGDKQGVGSEPPPPVSVGIRLDHLQTSLVLLLTAPLSVHQVMINGHALWPPLSARGCDPCRPGNAVQVERPQRSEDERPGRSAVSGTAWRRPPRSRNVACATRRCLSEWRWETVHRPAVAAAG